MSVVHRALIGLSSLLLAMAVTVIGTTPGAHASMRPSTARTPAAVRQATPAVPVANKGPVGWDTYRQLDRLPELTQGVATKQFSSFDRTGGNADWWSSPSQCMRLVDGSCVVAEHSGPGEVDAIWFTWAGGDVTSVGNITITLDGVRVLHAPLQDVVDGKLGAPFVYPLVANADQSSGGVYVAVPMPFRSSMLITTDSADFYYHVTYRVFADAVGVSTFNPGDQANDVVAMLRAAGTRDPKPAAGPTRTADATVTLAAGQTNTIATDSGPGELTAIRLRLPQAQYVAPRSVTDDGRAFGAGGSSVFTVAVDPANHGVRLTRRLDPVIGHQVATVAVDGTVVGQWAPNDYIGDGEWLDESVELPASVTTGKSRITIRNSFVSSDVDYNEFTYWVDSIVGGGDERTDTVDVGNAASESAHSYQIAGQTWSGLRTYFYPLDAGQLAQLHVAQQLLQGLRLRISFDGQQLVDSPLGEFFGSGFGVAKVNSLMFGMDQNSGWYSAWWPMPYRDGATVSLYNGSALPVSGLATEVTAAHVPAVAAAMTAGAIGYFHATSHAGPTTLNQDWSYLQATGTGKFVGDTVDMQGPSDHVYLEGDERVYVDDLRSPQLHGTGTEDFYTSGWYFNRGVYTTPLHGNTSHFTANSGCSANADCTSAYRLMLAEAVPFGADIHFGIEHGGTDDAAANYASTAYWYGSTRTTATQTDALTIGDPSSVAAHGYHAADPGQVSTLTDTYEGQDGPQTPVTMTVQAVTAPVTFTLSLRGDNAGAVLVRTSDQATGYQSAAVAVDGLPLPDWVQPLANPYHRWLDDTYPLPVSVTAGRSSITVTLTPRAGSPAWSAAGYRALSITPLSAGQPGAAA